MSLTRRPRVTDPGPEGLVAALTGLHAALGRIEALVTRLGNPGPDAPPHVPARDSLVGLILGLESVRHIWQRWLDEQPAGDEPGVEEIDALDGLLR